MNELWKQLWLPILVIALVLWWALDPMYKKFRAAGREAACEISLAIARRHVIATRFAGRFWVPVPKFPISRARHLNPNLDKSVFAKTP